MYAFRKSIYRNARLRHLRSIHYLKTRNRSLRLLRLSVSICILLLELPKRGQNLTQKRKRQFSRGWTRIHTDKNGGFLSCYREPLRQSGCSLGIVCEGLVYTGADQMKSPLNSVAAVGLALGAVFG